MPDSLQKWIEQERVRLSFYPESPYKKQMVLELAVIEAAENLMIADYADADEVGVTLWLEDKAALVVAIDNLRKLVTNAG